METNDQWEELLNPETVQRRLISLSLFLMTYEVLKATVIDKIKDLYTSLEDGVVKPSYKDDVLSRAKSPVDATLKWLIEQGAVTAEDIVTFDKLRQRRNIVAHQIDNIIIGGEWNAVDDDIEAAHALLRKIEVWRILNFEVPCDPDFDGREVDSASIDPGATLILRMIHEVARGNDEFLKALRKTASNC